jgi:large exoprotein involved in heme utilization and adhesion
LSINVNENPAESVELSGSGGLSLAATGTGSAGNLTINARALMVRDGAQISAETQSGEGRDIRLQGLNTLQVSNSAQISASTRDGQAGNLSINVNENPAESVELSGSGGLSLAATGTGSAGNLTINTRALTVRDGAGISAETNSGEGRNIRLQGLNTLQVSNSGQISASTRDGQAGNLSINVNENPAESVELSGSGGLSLAATGTGSAGNLTINARALMVRDGAQISAATQSGEGGNISLEGLNTLQVNNSLISASTRSGRAGNLSVNAANSVQLNGAGGLSVEATEGGTAGNLTIATGQLTIQNGTQATVSSPQGEAGNLTVQADSLFLNRGRLTAETGAGGANINLQVSDLFIMRNESLISANALGTASGGNININTGFLIALPPQGPEGSDIIANAFQGNGGRVNLAAQGIFGIEFRQSRTPMNDITASSEFGSAGIVAISTPNVDPSQGLTSLPTNVVDPSGLIDRRCEAASGSGTSQFTITGRGGLPSNPNEILGEEGLLEDLGTSVVVRNREPGARQAAAPTSVGTPPNPLVEAQGWIIGPDGNVILTAEVPTVTPQHPWQTPVSCRSALSPSPERLTVSPH